MVGSLEGSTQAADLPFLIPSASCRHEQAVLVLVVYFRQRADDVARQPANAAPLLCRRRKVNPDPHLTPITHHSMSLYVQIRLIPKFQNSTTMMAMALARL